MRKLEEELFQNRLKKNTNQLENTMLIRNARREIARVKTVLGEKLRGRRLPRRRRLPPRAVASQPPSVSALRRSSPAEGQET